MIDALQDLAMWEGVSDHPSEAKLRQAAERLGSGDHEGARAILNLVLEGPGQELAIAWLARAEAHRGLDDAPAARADYLAAVEHLDQVPAAVCPLLARGLLATDADEEAVSALSVGLDALIERNPEQTDLFVTRGEVYRARGHLANAANEFAYAAELDEDNLEAWLGLAACETALDRSSEAAAALDRAADVDPNAIGLFAQLGETWLDAGDPARAVRAFEEGLELASGEPALYRGRARASLELDLFEDALEDCRTLIELVPDDADAWWLMGRALYGVARDGESVRALDRCLELDPDRVEALRLRGHAHLAQGSWPAAEPDYRRALELDPDDADTHLALADAHLEQGSAEIALAEAEHAMELRPALADAYVLAARARAQSGDAAGAVEALDQGIERAPREPELYLDRAVLLLQSERTHLAWRDLRWAVDMDPFLAPAYVLRAQLALAIEGPEEALADLDAAIEIDPDDGEAFAWRGRAYQLTGDRDAAERDWAQAEALLPAEDPLRDQIGSWRNEG